MKTPNGYNTEAHAHNIAGIMGRNNKQPLAPKSIHLMRKLRHTLPRGCR